MHDRGTDEAKRGGEMTRGRRTKLGYILLMASGSDASLTKGATSHPYVHLLKSGAR